MSEIISMNERAKLPPTIVVNCNCITLQLARLQLFGLQQ